MRNGYAPVTAARIDDCGAVADDRGIYRAYGHVPDATPALPFDRYPLSRGVIKSLPADTRRCSDWEVEAFPGHRDRGHAQADTT
jgi:hypothetical protein